MILIRLILDRHYSCHVMLAVKNILMIIITYHVNGVSYISELRPPTGLLFISQVVQRKTPNLYTRALESLLVVT
jgi:hypothetical protein